MFVKGGIYRGWKGCYTTLKGGVTSETAGCAFSAHYSATGYGWLSVSRGGDAARFGFSYHNAGGGAHRNAFRHFVLMM